MSRFWSKLVHQLTPYTPGEQPTHARLVKLNTNENPYPPAPAVLDAIRAATDAQLRLYPDPESTQARAAIARYFQLEPSQVFLGNGSDEVLAHVFAGLLKQERPLLFPDISYSFYPVYCGLYDITFETVALDDDFAIQVGDYAHPSGAVILPNPNAPTGRLLPLSAIETLLKQSSNRLVVVDEAYIDFGGMSAASLLPHYDNLLVVQTLSKSRSLAGLRVGYALGNANLIEALNRVKNSFNSYPLDRLAQAAIPASFAADDYFRHACAQVVASRTYLVTALEQRGFRVLPSAANFIFAQPASGAAETLAQALREQGVIVRHFKQPERIRSWLRISIGTDAECDALLAALDQISQAS